MLTREQRIERAMARIAEKAVGNACSVGAWWGIPVESAAAALESAAQRLLTEVTEGRLHWPSEGKRRVSNGTPDQTVRSMASALIGAQAEPPTAEAVARTPQARGVRRRREDLLRLVDEARECS